METGIYILITKDGYRVTYSNQYTNLFGRYDDATNNFEINTEVLLQEFGDCFVFHHKEPAQQEAVMISKQHSETDNGIMNINYSRYTFEELINGSKKKTLA
jgi:hypothetical protein